VEAGERRRPLNVGLHLPNGAGMHAGGTARWSDLLAMVRRAEDLGFDSLIESFAPVLDLLDRG